MGDPAKFKKSLKNQGEFVKGPDLMTVNPALGHSFRDPINPKKYNVQNRVFFFGRTLICRGQEREGEDATHAQPIIMGVGLAGSVMHQYRHV